MRTKYNWKLNPTASSELSGSRELVIHESFTLIFREMIPVQPARGARAAQLCLARPQPFFAAALSVLCESQQGRALAGSGQLPQNGNHLLII
jgi:hypothetical protein